MRGILRDLRKAADVVDAEIRANASGGRFVAGLSTEGYAGGYRDALSDVHAALSGYPSSTSRFWPRRNL